MSQSIKIGTITANYNNAKYLKECLQSILNQTLKPNIICIIDDGSKHEDITLIYQIFEELNIQLTAKQPKMDNSHIYGWHFGRARNHGIQIAFYIAKENKGPARARNIGLEYLKDKVDVVFIADADDVYYSDKIKKSIDIMKKYQYVGLVYSDYDIYNESTGETQREYKEPFNLQKLFQECIVSNNSCFLTKAIEKVGYYDESLFGPEDYDMWLRLADYYAVYHIPEALYKYRISGNNITITTPKAKFAEHVARVHQKALERYNGKI